MNRLKYVLRINVSRRVATAIEPRPKELHKRHYSEARLVKPTQFLVPRRRKFYDFRGLHYASHQQRNKPKSSLVSAKRTSLERNVPVGSVQKRRNLSNQLVKSLNGKRYLGRSNERAVETMKEANNAKMYRTNVTGSAIEREPRSYAQMIANYSEAMYAQSVSGVLKDGLSSSLPNAIHRSPFSTVSTVSLKWKNREKVSRNACVRSTAFDQDAKFSSKSFTMRHDSRNVCKDFDGPIGGSIDLERTPSYATMIEKYSNAMNLGTVARSWSNSLVPRRSVSTSEKIDDLSMTLLDAKEIENKPVDTEACSKKESNQARNLIEASDDEMEAQKQTTWVTKMEDIIKDLERITAEKDAADEATRSNEKQMMQSVNERADWLCRVVGAHKKKIRDKKSGEIVQAELNEHTDPEMAIWSNDLASASKGDSSIGQATQMSTAGDKPSNPISDYIRRGPASSNTPNSTQKSTTQTPTSTNVINSNKEPQIELRMTPSQNESVVSINVDELVAKTAGASRNEQLSVVISSKRNKASKEGSSNLNPRSDFGSMQISISENTVPVKQIEFSINGKPVSELKSIVARADRLDVVSSLDKVEIRVPSSKGNAKMVNDQTKTAAGSVASTKPVLNLQIAAKFNEPRVQQPRETGLKTETSTTQNPPAPKPPQHFFKPAGTRYERLKSMNENIKHITTPNVTVRKPLDVSGPKAVEPPFMNNARATIQRQEVPPNVTDCSPSTLKIDDAALQKSTANTPPAKSTYQPSMNTENPKTNKSIDHRTPSNTIPWWSSEYPYKNIRKKQNGQKNLSVLQNDSTLPKKAEEIVNVIQKAEYLSNSKPMPNQQSVIDTLKSVTPGKDVVVQKRVVDENERSSDLPESVLRVIRVRSPKKWIPFTSRGVRSSKRKSASSGGKIGKKTKHRLKNIARSAKTSKGLQREPDKQTVSAIGSPNVTVSPRRVIVSEEPDVAKAKEHIRLATKIKASKIDKELGKATTQDPSDTERAIVQHLKTVLKEAKDLEKSVNKSADVSAKPSASSTEHSLEGTKGKGEAGRAVAKDTIEKKKPDEVSGEKIQKIIKSMKPIEKRKDGTLIDYGVTVPSRKPSETSRKTSGVRNKIPINVELKKVITETSTKLKSKSSQRKVVELENQPLIKERTQTQAKSTLQNDKIVEPEKISSVKKHIEITNLENKKLSAAESKMKLQKVGNVSVVKKQTHGGQKLPVTIENINSKTRKGISSSESRKNVSVPQFLTTKMPSSTRIEKAPLEGTITDRSSKTSIRKREFDTPNIPKNISLDTPKDMPYERTVTPSWLKIPEKKGLPESQKMEDTKKAPFEGTIIKPSPTTSKKMANVDVPPLGGTITPPTSQISSIKFTKKDSISQVKSTSHLDRKSSNTGAAPFEGTIAPQSTKKKVNLINFSSANKQQRTHMGAFKEKEKEVFLKFSTPKTSSNKNGSTNPGGSSSAITGPAGSNTNPRASSMTQGTLKDKIAMSVDYSNEDRKPGAKSASDATILQTNDDPDRTIVLFSHSPERPEKSMLYSAWLQRFKNELDDDKII